MVRPRLRCFPRRCLPLLLVAFLGACATTPFIGWNQEAPFRGFNQPAPFIATADPTVVALREKLAEGARSILGRTQLVVRGKRFNMDCTGVVLAVYWYAGVDLAREFNRWSGTGVQRIYRTLERQNLLYTTTEPLVGDVIFWDNTYDENEDFRWNDPLSHVGMVTGVDPDGTISYIHYHVTKGIRIDYMNLRNPGVQSMLVDGRMKVVNSPLRLAVPGQPHPPNWLSGQLYRVLGLAYLLQ